MKKTGKRRAIRTPLKKSLTRAGVILLVYFILVLINGGLIRNDLNIILDMFLCGAGFLFWMVFFSQFILPVKSIREREMAISRLFSYLAGIAGPVVRIENGVIIERKVRPAPGPG